MSIPGYNEGKSIAGVSRFMMRHRKLLLIPVILFFGLLYTVRPAAADQCLFYSNTIGYICPTGVSSNVFQTLQKRDDSLLDSTMYAFLYDDANVYSSPSLAAPVVRNVGQGYFYVTIRDRLNIDDVLWYEINPGEFVHQDDIREVEISEFTGLEISAQPERPFGWFVAAGYPSRTPGGTPDETLPRLFRYTFFQVFEAVNADDGWIWYNIGGGLWIPQTLVSLVDVSPRPEGVGPDEFWVEVDLYEQTAAAYEGDRMVYATLVSSGLNRWPTNEGLFQVWDRWEKTKMSGAEGKVDYYFIEDVPHTMFFDYDIALHGAFWHDRFGYKHSHGCVNMPPRSSEWVYYWSEDAPTDLWVYVHTSDPSHIFQNATANPTESGAKVPARTFGISVTPSRFLTG